MAQGSGEGRGKLAILGDDLIAGFRKAITVVIEEQSGGVMGGAEGIGMNVIVDIDAIETCFSDDSSEHGGQ
jgi:hypothetical protein